MEITKYKRDSRSPVPKDEKVSKVMSANKAKDTKPELLLRKALWDNNLKGYRLHKKELPGKPDISFMKEKVAIFVNGCYWHRCPYCDLSMPKTNAEFWQNKFSANQERDKKKSQLLVESGWIVLVIWECQIKQGLQVLVSKISDLLIKSR
ncbi:very short patch repair endonuclease [Fibrella forsythiae]|uniref:Very short patch repair endonuclease n=1 Tax=Fibrella forsythiae TaxID=2817061 RepID=A0ABS3JUJ1_9BACT|nr:very short patch repair endonuclease [Fibrella forsythiae]MBO0953113.1 very short patch repair endonuclease [Fibrella forsythiae]